MRALGALAMSLCLAGIAACSGGSSASSSQQGPQPGSQSMDVQTGIGPIPLTAGQETTVCVVKPLGNTADMVLQGFGMDLAPGSHHLIVYLTDATVQDTPFACTPFTGVAIGNDVPLAFANTEKIDFAFPDGVGMDIRAGSNIKIEAHYINTTASDIQGQGTVTLHGTAKATAPAYQAANFLAFGTLNIDIPPNSSYSTGPRFQAAEAGMHLMLITTHEHRLGTRAQVWASSAAGDLSTQIADDQDWANPAWKMLATPVDFDGSNGLTYQCDWTNTTDQTVTFGESALNEMCIVAGYYYPSKGVYGCIDGHCRFR